MAVLFCRTAGPAVVASDTMVGRAGLTGRPVSVSGFFFLISVLFIVMASRWILSSNTVLLMSVGDIGLE